MLRSSTKFKFGMWLMALASFGVGGIRVHQTAIASNTIIATTNVTIGGSATPTIVPPVAGTYFLQFTDDITLSLDANYDWWLEIYFSSGATVVNVGIITGGDTIGGYTLGNQLATNPISVATPITPAYAFAQIVSA